MPFHYVSPFFNKQMRFFYLMALLLGTGLCVSAAVEDAVVVEMTDGAKKYIRMADSPRVYVTDTNIKVTSTGSDIELPRKEVRAWTFGEYDFDAADIGLTSTDSPTAVTAGRTVTLGGLAPGSEGRLYDADGRLVDYASASSEGTMTLTTPASGAYVVKADGITFKSIIRK